MLVHEDRFGHCLVQMFLIFILVKSATVKQSNDVESCGFAAPRCVDLNCVCSPCLNLKQLKVPGDGASLGYWARLPCRAAYHGERGLLGQSNSEFYYYSN